MKRSWLFVLALVLAIVPFCAVQSQAPAPAPAGYEHWTAADIKALGKTLATAASGDPHKTASKQIADYPNDLFMLAHREGDGQAELHETQADVFFVESGTATLLVGGTLHNAETTAPHEKRNGTIEGGTRQKLSAGDIVRIAANTPHQMLLEGSKEF